MPLPDICPVLPAAAAQAWPLPLAQAWPLHGVQATRALELQALARSAPHALMAQAGLGLARLALALAPHASRVWVACGPGNNGGDGLVAARCLRQQGREVLVTLLGDAARLPADAAQALAQWQQCGGSVQAWPHAAPPAGLVVDALLGLGSTRAPEGAMAGLIGAINAHGAPVLAADLPSGLHADTGALLGAGAVRARHTLALLTLKPGLFTALGRGHSGQVWLAPLGQRPAQATADAWLHHPAPDAWPPRAHHHHKGSFGDVLVLGGAPGMGGAAWLAANAALTAGAGRVLAGLLDEHAGLCPHPQRPELMPRAAASLLQAHVLAQATVVCGCGGGAEVAAILPVVLSRAARLVLDADALNAVAANAALRGQLRARSGRGLATVLTPHPLEAARLLASDTAAVQADRLGAAQRLAQEFAATVLLKGSGSVVASPGELPRINPSGNARLASAGTGDVLAGWLGGHWSAQAHAQPHTLAADVAWLHGAAAEAGPAALPLRAADLVDAMAGVVDKLSACARGPACPAGPRP